MRAEVQKKFKLDYLVRNKSVWDKISNVCLGQEKGEKNSFRNCFWSGFGTSAENSSSQKHIKMLTTQRHQQNRNEMYMLNPTRRCQIEVKVESGRRPKSKGSFQG